MENASKALIIAGAVLLAIMIIALGVTIFNRARNSADTTALDSTEITMFNQKFERYADTQKGSNVKSLISYAISNASTNKDDGIKLPTIGIYASENATTPNSGVGAPGGQTASASNEALQTYITLLSNIRKNINTTTTYTVYMEYDTTGLITTIKIVPPTT